MTSFECPINCLITEGGVETLQTVKLPSDAPYASMSELVCPNLITVTKRKIAVPLSTGPYGLKGTINLKKFEMITHGLALVKNAMHPHK